MTRQERLRRLADSCAGATSATKDARQWPGASDGVECAEEDGCVAGHYGNVALDHLAALEQQAIDAYLSNVPLPEGWHEEPRVVGRGVIDYYDESDEHRVSARAAGVTTVPTPQHWPPIPLPVLIRAAVQCHRLREAGRS